MQTTKFTIEGMSCQHCVDTITKGLKELKGIGKVVVDLERKNAQVDYDESEIGISIIKKTLDDLGYDITTVTDE